MPESLSTASTARHEPSIAAAGHSAADLQARETFLGSVRAQPICAREFDRLADEIARRAVSAAAETAGAAAEIRRSPGRCIVQLGPVALTASWVRSRVDTVSAGRLLIVEWRGTVARGAERIPERSPIPGALARTATPIREGVWMADATGQQDWLWRREAAPEVGYGSVELAEHCVDSLVETLRGQLA